MFQKARTILSRDARRTFSETHPVAAIAIGIVLFGPPSYFFVSWIESNPLQLPWHLDLALRAVFTKSNAALGAYGVFWTAILVGLAFYLLRQKMRPLYAIIELGFGAVAAGVAANRLYIQLPSSLALSEQFALYTALIAAFYVIVRGWDNLSKVVDTDPHAARIKPYWQSWLGKP
ncbi:hypothetical protein [Microvirga terricola]|uniref:Uncharacterized protein n=1 Tax=Microvirga terricola TaxID=2719797 RepID=A0ABX0VGT5_9HYPH|nr:hypothetical protein [Microvirga terricola]NIX77367.1 hypothetical protein [Microvirga terricola]